MDRSDLAGQLGRVGDLEEGGELGGFLRGEDPGIDDALVGRARLVIDPRFLAVLVRAPTDRFVVAVNRFSRTRTNEYSSSSSCCSSAVS